jgi:hypothetical protein
VAVAGPRGLLLGLAGFVFSVASVCLWLWLVTAMGFLTPAPFLAWLITGTIVAAGVLSAIPVPYGIAGPDFPPAIFCLIVTSILVFCLGVALVGRMPDEADPIT